MRKLSFVLALFVSAGLASSASAQLVGIGTSPQGSLTYQIGASVSKVLQDKGKIQSRIQPQSGTGTMIPLLNSGELDIGFANTAEVYDAFHGVGTFPKRPNKNLRVVAVIFPLIAGLFVRADSDIKSIKDMKGKRITYGLTSQEIVRKTVDAMLATGGLTIKDLQPVMVPNVVRGAGDLAAGRVDIAVFAIGAPKVAEVAASVGGIRFIPLENTPKALAALKKEFPTGYFSEVKPRPNLVGVTQPMTAMYYDYSTIVGAHVSNARVKEITRLIAENQDALAKGQPRFRGMVTKRLFNNFGVPYHPGAIAYYKEKGIAESK
ncbi:MAG: TAXI family TRAP transporter solute-binding subunit [Xanthobacteraceae bacterium]